ncbi:hypothetical protein GEMRC1_014064 [Eukaryota sp. GEM-RC1]
MNDVSERTYDDMLYGKTLTVKSDITKRQLLAMFPTVKLIKLSPATVIVTDFPSSTQVHDLRNYFGNGFKLIKTNFGGSVQFHIQCTSKTVSEALFNLQQCPFFTQSHEIFFTNDMGIFFQELLLQKYTRFCL